MTIWLCVLAAFAGVLNPVQSGANGHLGKIIGNPFYVVLVSLSISLAFTLVMILILPLTDDLSYFRRLSLAPWWSWIGGVCGAVFVLSQPLVAPRLGASMYIGITVTASVLSSVILDHFGLLGFPEHPISVARLIGAGLMITGVIFIAKG